MEHMVLDSSVRVYASRYQAHRLTTEENKGKLVINVCVSMKQCSFDETQPIFKRNLARNTWLCEKTFNYGQDAFLYSDEAQQREITAAMIQDMDIPFPWKNVYWAISSPTGTEPKLENIDKAIDRLLAVARLACKEKGAGFMNIQITKVEMVSLEEYRKSEEALRVAKPPGLEDWIKENMNDLNVNYALKFIFNHRHMSSKDNPHFGLKPVTVKDENKEEPCAICKQDMKRGVIQMPCSHIFHGLCLFPWLVDKPTCPLCRFDLLHPKVNNLNVICSGQSLIEAQP